MNDMKGDITMGRMNKAIQDYRERIDKNIGCFYTRDFVELLNISSDKYDLMMNSVFAGFIIGFRCGKREAKRKEKK